MHEVQTPADIAKIKSAHKAILLIYMPKCDISGYAKECLERIADRNTSMVAAVADATEVPGLTRILGISEFPTALLYRRGRSLAGC